MSPDGLWGLGGKSQPHPCCRALWTRRLASSQSPGFQRRKTTKQDMWLPCSKPPLSFICDKPLFINPRTAHRHWGEGSDAAEREKQLEIQLVL